MSKVFEEKDYYEEYVNYLTGTGEDIDLETIERLLNSLNDEEKISKTFGIYDTAIENDRFEVVELLFKMGFDVNENEAMKETGESILTNCVFNNVDPKYLELLLDNKADIEMTGQERTALFWACDFGHLELVKTLLKYQANVNFIDCAREDPLFLAAYDNYVEIAELLIEHGASVNGAHQCNETPLYIATKNNNPDIVKLLIDNKCDLPDNCSTSLLEMAANNKMDPNLIMLLIEHKADLNNRIRDMLKHHPNETIRNLV
eukprot:TRINITY_DN1698_c0_g1_i2.p1 TRINITY_DN1698_c0_g1~~TRINITY_DN1698_c0_g1_i2.p1  ORF type:complete len:260 (+),score=44.05 TRINITY_DN1698_c0_g1_i2:157-936(+)